MWGLFIVVVGVTRHLAPPLQAGLLPRMPGPPHASRMTPRARGGRKGAASECGRRGRVVERGNMCYQTPD